MVQLRTHIRLTHRIGLLIVAISIAVMAVMSAIAQAQPNASSEKAITIAVVYTLDKSGYRNDSLAEMVQFLLPICLRDLEGVEVVPYERVSKFLADNALQPPLNAKEMISVAKGVNADLAMRAVVESISISKKHRRIAVSLSTESFGSELGIIVNRTRVEGIGDIIGDPKSPNAIYGAVVAAIDDACVRTAEQFEYSYKVRGLLLLPPMENHIRSNLGIHHGLKVGAELVITYRGSPMAWAKVVDVDYDDCRAKLTKVRAGAELFSGMQVQVIYNPPRHEDLTHRQKIERELRRATRHLVIAIVVVTSGLVAADVIQ